MAWDSKSARRRQGSTASGSSRSLPSHTRQQSKQVVIQPSSPHVADPFLQHFLDPSFDPVTYLNSVLPPLQQARSASTSHGVSGAAGGGSGAAAVPLAELAAQAQASVSQLNVHTTRLANTLTQLTDDILRSGSRLAYEVELLRGETLGLAETLTEGLHDNIVKFVPGGIGEQNGQPRPATAGVGAPHLDASETSQSQSQAQPQADPVVPLADDDPGDPPPGGDGQLPSQPAYITQLRTLTLVRSRLDSVIKTFGDAMEFVFPPSEVSVSSSFLSVSAPEPGSDSHSTEEKGQQVLRRLRDEVSALAANNADPLKGVEDAARRVAELKALAAVWRGTAEEKGRAKFIESLAKIVEDRHRDLLREFEQANASTSGAGAGVRRDGGALSRADTETSVSSRARSPLTRNDGGSSTESKGYSGGYGFINQLQKIRGGL